MPGSERGAMSSGSPRETPVSAWSAAVMLLTQWIETGERSDVLLEQIPRGIVGQERARAQSLFFGAIRHFGRLNRHLTTLVSRTPRPRLQAILLVAGFELLEGGDEHHVARVVHHAVEQAKTLASEAEARLVNAVVRKLAGALATEAEPPKLAPAEVLAAYYSHPEWLVRRWLAQFGAGPTRSLLEWNQKPGPMYARWRLTDREPNEAERVFLTPTAWPGYFEVRPGHWADITRLLDESAIYLQDPSTRVPIELLDPVPGKAIIDTCSAPGGKSVAIADLLASQGTAAKGTLLVSLDLPGKRIDRLKENLNKIKGVDVALVQADVLEAGKILKLHELPLQYARVLIDVPCSNTGVMRHRVDVKWRLQETDFEKHARQQLNLLNAASRLVAPQGRLVYSTCSLDAEENEKVVNAFVERTKGRYTLMKSVLSLPWEAGHDGAAAFVFERRS